MHHRLNCNSRDGNWDAINGHDFKGYYRDSISVTIFDWVELQNPRSRITEKPGRDAGTDVFQQMAFS
jgi:hypothetical protein